MLILRLSFPGGEGEFEVVVVQNFTDSDQFAESVSEAIEMLSPDDVIYRGLVVEMDKRKAAVRESLVGTCSRNGFRI